MLTKIAKRHPQLDQFVQNLFDAHPPAERLIFPNQAETSLRSAIVLFRTRPAVVDFHNQPVPPSADKPPYLLSQVSLTLNGKVLLGPAPGVDLYTDPKRAFRLLSEAVAGSRNYHQVYDGSDLFFLPHTFTCQGSLL